MSPFWLTFKQATDLGGRVRKGEKSLPVIYFKVARQGGRAGNPVLREDGQAARIPFARWANVFNLDQTEGIEAPAILTSTTACEPLEGGGDRFGAKLCPIVHSGFAAAYSPKRMKLGLHAPANFRSMEDYYQTLFHEMTHATGHISQLNREAVNQPIKFGSAGAILKGGIGRGTRSCILANEAGTLDQVQFNNSAAYLSSWIQKAGGRSQVNRFGCIPCPNAVLTLY